MSRAERKSIYTAEHFGSVAVAVAEGLKLLIRDKKPRTDHISPSALQPISELFATAADACRNGEPQNPISDDAVCYQLVRTSLARVLPNLTRAQQRQKIQNLYLVVDRLKAMPLPTDSDDYPTLIALLEDIDRRGEEAAYDRFMDGDDDDE